MDKFDHQEKTFSGIGKYHATILILLQKIKNTGSYNEQLQISQKTF